MKHDEILRATAERALMGLGLVENEAESFVHAITTNQPEEWQRTLDRCERGEVDHIYIVTAQHRSHLDVFLYAPGPGDENNLVDVMELLGTEHASGWVDSPGGIKPAERGACPVAVFDIARDMVKMAKGLRAEGK